MPMKKLLIAFLVIALPFGCMSATIKAPAESVRGIHKIVVVPMEAPPLEVAPFMASVALAGAGSYLVSVPERTIRMGGKVGIIVCGIFMLMELPAAARENAWVHIRDSGNPAESGIPATSGKV